MFTVKSLSSAVYREMIAYAKTCRDEDHQPFYCGIFNSVREWVDFWMEGEAGFACIQWRKHGKKLGFDHREMMERALAEVCDLDKINCQIDPDWCEEAA